jgi:hypothetical protein
VQPAIDVYPGSGAVPVRATFTPTAYVGPDDEQRPSITYDIEGGYLELRLSSSGVFSVEVFDLLGRLPMQLLEVGSDRRVSLAALAAGVYHVRIQSGETQWTERIIIR